MIPTILTVSNKKDTEKFLLEYEKKHQIKPQYVFRIVPEGKEFSIAQIRDIKKNIIYDLPQPVLYILYDFDTASYEAQNAFLKTLEEHRASLHFIMVVENSQSLLPTIISRSKITSIGQKKEELSETTEKELETFIEKGSLAVLKVKLSPEDIILFFRKRLDRDALAPKILSEAVKTRSYTQNNNVDKQLAVDHLLILIKNTYKL